MKILQPIILAVTGGIACGKSEVGRILADAGFDVLDTDRLAHDVMKTGTPVFEQVVENFGKSVLGLDGEIDRSQLGRIVFADPMAREALNGLVHPAVIEAAERWKAVRRAAGQEAVVLVPLLFEVDWTQGWNAIVCVSADEDVVFQRLEKRGLNEEEARKRIAAQMPLAEKMAKADFVIRNNETLDALREKTMEVLEWIRSRGNDHE